MKNSFFDRKMILHATLAVFLLSGYEAGYAEDLERAKLLEKHAFYRGAIAKAKSAWERSRIYEELFKEAGSEEMERLKNDENLGIGVRAAWEEILRTFPEQEAKDFVTTEPERIWRFLGFLEAKIGASVPGWWEQALLGAHAYRRKHIWFKPPSKDCYHATGFGLFCPKDTTLEMKGDTYQISVNGKVAEVPQTLVDINKRKHRFFCAVVGSEEIYVAFHDNICFSFRLYRIDKGQRKPSWEAEIWAGGGFTKYQGALDLFVQRVSIEVKQNRIIVYGASDDSLYVEIFDKQGSAKLRFSTSY